MAKQKKVVLNTKSPPKALRKEIYRNYVLSNLFTRIFKEDIEKKTGICLMEWKILETIFHYEGIFARDIINIWEMEKSAASRSITRLESMGLLIREKIEDDKRHYKILITPEGKEMYRTLRNLKNNLFKYIENNLPASDLVKFGKISEKMIDLLRVYLSDDKYR